MALRWREQVTMVNVNWIMARYWKSVFVLENLVEYMYSKCRYCPGSLILLEEAGRAVLQWRFSFRAFNLLPKSTLPGDYMMAILSMRFSLIEGVRWQINCSQISRYQLATQQNFENTTSEESPTRHWISLPTSNLTEGHCFKSELEGRLLYARCYIGARRFCIPQFSSVSVVKHFCGIPRFADMLQARKLQFKGLVDRAFLCSHGQKRYTA